MSDQLILETAEVGPWPMNSYVLISPKSRESLLIDPGAEPDTLAALLVNTAPKAIILTHTHQDHIGALDEMKARLGVPVYKHPLEPGPTADEELSDGGVLKLGDYAIRLVHTPGHSPGMVTLRLPDNRAIVGDTIFEGGPGKTWTPEGFRTTLDTLAHIVLSWPDDTVCYPGHGPAFVLGEKRQAIEAFVNREHPADRHGDLTWES